MEHNGEAPQNEPGQSETVRPPLEQGVSRRSLLRGFGAGALLLSSAVPSPAMAEPQETSRKPAFTFLYLTDPHIQPELGAVKGVKKAFEMWRRLPEKPAFALIGGDIVMDVAYVERKRAEELYDLWQEAASQLSLPLYYTVGNHDVYAIGGSHKVAGDDPEYGKKMWLRRLGLERPFNTFDHQGWRFILLDSVKITPGGNWEGMLEEQQLRWLDDLLRKTPRTMPLVFLTHIPLLTIYGQYTSGATQPLSPSMVIKNGKVFLEMVERHTVRAVLQGHTHVVEECIYRGTRYITGGAVCGDWWKGPRLGVHPEGIGLVRVEGEELTWQYLPYGWDAKKHQPAPGKSGS